MAHDPAQNVEQLQPLPAKGSTRYPPPKRGIGNSQDTRDTREIIVVMAGRETRRGAESDEESDTS
jgi:hypothetical protein